MKKIFILLLLLSVSCSFAGCKKYIKGRYEIDKLDFPRVLAFDKGKEGNVEVTIVSKNTYKQDDSNTEIKKANIVSSEGRTVFEALRLLNIYSEKKPFYGHTEFILFGEELAKEGIRPYIDFITRDHEMRINSKVYLVKGAFAKEMLEKANTSQFFIGEMLGNLEKARDTMSISSDVKILEVMYILDSPYLSLFIPCLDLSETIQKSGQDEEKLDINMKGYALFKEGKLVGHLAKYEARGLNWLKNLISSGIIVVKDMKDEYVSLEIIESNTKIEPLIRRDGSLKATVKIDLTTNIGEILGTEDIFNKQNLEYIEKEQERVVKEEVLSVIRFALENKMDFFSLGTKFFQKYPRVWKTYEKSWEEWIPTIDFQIEVDSNITRSYLLNEPDSREEEKQ